MPLYMDVHTVNGGVNADDVAKAHIADLQTQGKHEAGRSRCWRSGRPLWPRSSRSCWTGRVPRGASS
jgi:hypothetical protein